MRKKPNAAFFCFNSQPPEGGWGTFWICFLISLSFNSQPPEGGWGKIAKGVEYTPPVSTHSRPKAAGSF